MTKVSEAPAPVILTIPAMLKDLAPTPKPEISAEEQRLRAPEIAQETLLQAALDLAKAARASAEADLLALRKRSLADRRSNVLQRCHRPRFHGAGPCDSASMQIFSHHCRGCTFPREGGGRCGVHKMAHSGQPQRPKADLRNDAGRHPLGADRAGGSTAEAGREHEGISGEVIRAQPPVSVFKSYQRGGIRS